MSKPGPLFSYYGSKWTIAPRYPAPRYPLIIEPFAGSAGYALRYPSHHVVLVDAYPKIAELWQYLTSTSVERIRALPDAFDLKVPLLDPERTLMGFWAAKASPTPRIAESPWATKYPGSLWWGPRVKNRLAMQVPQIRHWSALCGDYSVLDNIEATWFIDPPYVHHGGKYVHGPAAIDYDELREWVLTRKGQVIVCEGHGATWLPFRPFSPGRLPTGAVDGVSPTEMIWYRESHRRPGVHSDPMPRRALPAQSAESQDDDMAARKNLTTTGKLPLHARVAQVMGDRTMSLADIIAALVAARQVPVDVDSVKLRAQISVLLITQKRPMLQNGTEVLGKDGKPVMMPVFARVERGVYKVASPSAPIHLPAAGARGGSRVGMKYKKRVKASETTSLDEQPIFTDSSLRAAVREELRRNVEQIVDAELPAIVRQVLRMRLKT